MSKSSSENQSRRDTFKRELARIEKERQRKAFHTKELTRFSQTTPWMKRGINHFKAAHTVREEIREELGAVASIHIKEQWRELKRRGDPITGGLVLRMTLRCLRRYAATDRTVLSYPHPERVKEEEEAQRLAELREEELTWKERAFQQTLRIDVRAVKNGLTVEGQNVLEGKRNGETSKEIRERLEVLGCRNSKRFIYNQLEIIRERLRERGY